MSKIVFFEIRLTIFPYSEAEAAVKSEVANNISPVTVDEPPSLF